MGSIDGMGSVGRMGSIGGMGSVSRMGSVDGMGSVGGMGSISGMGIVSGIGIIGSKGSCRARRQAGQQICKCLDVIEPTLFFRRELGPQREVFPQIVIRRTFNRIV
jgi:hypothetical protein